MARVREGLGWETEVRPMWDHELETQMIFSSCKDRKVDSPRSLKKEHSSADPV